MTRLNFGSGPARLPSQVLEESAEAIRDFQESGLSILEIPHRERAFLAILEEAKALVLELLELDNDYEVLWMQGGGRLQFSLLPMNFLGSASTAGYLDTGHWSGDAIAAARFFGDVDVLASSKAEGYVHIPKLSAIDDSYAYVHLTSNNTIYGTQFMDFPACASPLVADMSSELFSRRLAYGQFDMIYAAAQKNIGPAGVTLVVVKKCFLEKANPSLPGILSYRAFSKAGSVLNTPPVFPIYCSLLVLRWLSERGLRSVELENEAKARLLYEAIDASSFFDAPVQIPFRSKMNVCFRSRQPEMDAAFVAYAASKGIVGIKGHRSVGGFRVALYNAITLQEVATLVEVLHEFERTWA